jgi:hypothetical protein
MPSQTTTSVTLRNLRNEYLFINEHSKDDRSTHIVLTDRNGKIIRSYDFPIPFKVFVRCMLKAGWTKR